MLERQRPLSAAAAALAAALLGVAFAGISQAESSASKSPSLPGTFPLITSGDLSATMVEGIDRFLDAATADSVSGRARFWERDFSSPEAYALSVEPNRQRLRAVIGAVDELVSPVGLEYIAGPGSNLVIAETFKYRVFAVRWPVFPGVTGNGLLLHPKGEVAARVIAIPDADHTPEMLAGLEDGLPRESQMARRLVGAGCSVLVPALVDRQNTWSGNPDIVMTDQTHREWVCRPAVEMGRHLIGYEVRKIESAIDWFRSQQPADRDPVPIGVTGYGEGGLVALFAAALDRRIDAALVSGYFDAREEMWREPLYRNLFGFLREFGDAEVASLVMPRALLVEHSEGPYVDGPPDADESRRVTAATGRIVSPRTATTRAEFNRLRRIFNSNQAVELANFIRFTGSNGAFKGPGSGTALRGFLSALGVEQNDSLNAGSPVEIRSPVDPAARQQGQVAQLVEHSQRLLRRAEKIRAGFWKDAVPADAASWPAATQPYKEHLWNEILGKLPDPAAPVNPRSRLVEDHDTWTAHEIMLDVWPPHVFAWGYLLVPKGIAPGERRPVVVCQHGLEGLPASVINEDEKSRDWRAYRAYANRLAERGFIVYAPHNPYRGGAAFRQLQRKANPLGLTLYSFILGQHQRTLEWLGTLPFVDEERIGFYGLSYGGVSALRIPALLDGYSLSICSAAFNDWTRKVMSREFRSAYVFTKEYDHFTFGLGATFDNAELAALIAPRPFMVERGHNDGVAPDEWVAWEYSKVRRHYARLGIPGRTAIEFFDGGHTINGQGTFEFLHRHLDWPK